MEDARPWLTFDLLVDCDIKIWPCPNKASKKLLFAGSDQDRDVMYEVTEPLNEFFFFC